MSLGRAVLVALCLAMVGAMPAALADAPGPVSGRVKPAPGVSTEQQLAWEQLIDQAFFETARFPGREHSSRAFAWKRGVKARIELMAADPLALTPAYINATIGRDLDNPETVACLAAMIQHWQTRILYSPSFYFDPSCDGTDLEATRSRTVVLEQWRDWWERKDYKMFLREYQGRLARTHAGRERSADAGEDGLH